MIIFEATMASDVGDCAVNVWNTTHMPYVIAAYNVELSDLLELFDFSSTNLFKFNGLYTTDREQFARWINYKLSDMDL